MAILETSGLRKIYGSGDTEVRALDGVDLTVEKGEFAAVVGTSGSGKSTLLHIYIISFTVIKYDLPAVDLTNILAAFTLYFPALIWEVSRKIRAPEDETEYVTYSKLFGYKKATDFVFFVTWVDIITNFILVWALNKVSVLLLLINVLWMSWKFIEFKKDPKQYKIVEKVERYTYIQESIMILTVVAFLLIGKI